MFKFPNNAVPLTQSLRRRGRPPPIIFAPIVRPMNALQICPRQFSHVLRLSRYERRDRKSAISLQRGQFNPKFQVDGVAPTNIFARIVRPVNALQYCR